MTRKTSTAPGIWDLIITTGALVLLAILFAVAYLILLAITYWYITISVIAGLLYLWYIRRSTPAQVNRRGTKIIESVQKTDAGTITTRETIHYGVPESRISQLIQTITGRT